MNTQYNEQSAEDLLLKSHKQFRVLHPIAARKFFKRFMEAGKSARGYKIRFVEIPEKCAIELQANHDYDMSILVKAMIASRIIKHELPFQLNHVVKLSYGRRDGRDFGAMN